MAWATPKTWRVGETPGSIGAHTVLNQDLRDSMLFLYSPPRAAAHRTGGGDNVPHATETTLPVNTPLYDTASMFDGGNDDIICQIPGYYLCFGSVTWEAWSGNCVVKASIRGYNNSLFDFLVTNATYRIALESIELSQELFAPTYLASGNHIRLSAWQNSGVTRAVVPGSSSNLRRVLGACWAGGV